MGGPRGGERTSPKKHCLRLSDNSLTGGARTPPETNGTSVDPPTAGKGTRAMAWVWGHHPYPPKTAKVPPPLPERVPQVNRVKKPNKNQKGF